MPITGAAIGAADALEQMVAQRMLAQKLEAEISQQQERQALDQRRQAEIERQNAEENKLRGRQLDLQDAGRRDANNARGLELMQSDRAAMDTNAAINALPPHLKPVGGLIKTGAMGKLSPEDLMSPQEREDAARAAEAREIRIRRASQAPREPRERQTEWIRRGDQVFQIDKGTAQAGDLPYDPVAARSSKPENDTEAQDTANEAGRLAQALLDHKGLDGAFGLWGSYIPTVRQDTADAETLLNSLTGLLTMENMGKMKGVLSDSDMKILRQASTTLGQGMSEGAARSELKRIVEVMGRVGKGASGSSPSAFSVTAPNEKTYTFNTAEELVAFKKRAGIP